MATRKSTLTSKSYSQAAYILPTPATRPVVTTQKADADEQGYENWKKANGLDRRLSRAEYETVFSIY